MRRLAVVVVLAVVGGVVVSAAHAALFFLFGSPTARTGETVTVRLGGTPRSFTPAQRAKPPGQPIRLYLAAAGDAAEIRGRLDPRLSFVGRIVPDRNFRGMVAFRVPPLVTGDYVLAYWCPGCARHSFGRTFGVQTVPEVSRYRRAMGLRVVMPDPATACPVTRGRYGNGLLSIKFPDSDGIRIARRESDGTLFDKLYWEPRRGFYGGLTVRAVRLDAAAEARVLRVSWGSGSWASAVLFPSEGCWRITGRVRDISLSYVVKVVAGS